MQAHDLRQRERHKNKSLVHIVKTSDVQWFSHVTSYPGVDAINGWKKNLKIA